MAVLTGELVVLVALAWRSPRSSCGAAIRPRGAGSRRSWGIAGVTALIAGPLLRATIFLPADGARDLSGWLAWSAAGLLAVVVTLVASRDPASRWRR